MTDAEFVDRYLDRVSALFGRFGDACKARGLSDAEALRFWRRVRDGAQEALIVFRNAESGEDDG